MSMHHVSAVHQLPAADGGMPDFGQMRKADLMKAAKAIGVPTRRQCTRDDGSTYRTWRSTTDVARECQQAWHERSERHIAPGAVSAVQAQATAGRIATETTSAQQLNESHAPSSASAMQAQIIAGRIVTETAASHQFNESHTPGSANAVQAQTGLETLAAGTATSQQIQEFTAPASARAVLVQNLSETHASHADTGNSTKVSSQTPTATSQASQFKRRSLLDHWIRKLGPAPVIDAPAHSAPVSGSAHRRSAARPTWCRRNIAREREADRKRKATPAAMLASRKRNATPAAMLTTRKRKATPTEQEADRQRKEARRAKELDE